MPEQEAHSSEKENPQDAEGDSNLSVKVFKDKAGEWRWSIIAANGRVMGDSSEGYKNQGDCLDALVKISEQLPEALDDFFAQEDENDEEYGS